MKKMVGVANTSVPELAQVQVDVGDESVKNWKPQQNAKQIYFPSYAYIDYLAKTKMSGRGQWNI